MASNRVRQHFACEMKRRMKALGWNQARIAEETGLTECAISKLMRGLNRPKLSTALKVARVLGIEVGELR